MRLVQIPSKFIKDEWVTECDASSDVQTSLISNIKVDKARDLSFGPVKYQTIVIFQCFTS